MAANHYLLDTIQGVLEGTEWNASNQGTVLHLQHSTSPDLVGAVSVVPASIRETPIGTISDVIQVTTKLPPAISQFFKDDPKAVLLGNKVASTGALYAEDGEYYVGSRATIYEGEDVEVITQNFGIFVSVPLMVRVLLRSFHLVQAQRVLQSVIRIRRYSKYTRTFLTLTGDLGCFAR